MASAAASRSRHAAGSRRAPRGRCVSEITATITPRSLPAYPIAHAGPRARRAGDPWSRVRRERLRPARRPSHPSPARCHAAHARASRDGARSVRPARLRDPRPPARPPCGLAARPGARAARPRRPRHRRLRPACSGSAASRARVASAPAIPFGTAHKQEASTTSIGPGAAMLSSCRPDPEVGTGERPPARARRQQAAGRRRTASAAACALSCRASCAGAEAANVASTQGDATAPHTALPWDFVSAPAAAVAPGTVTAAAETRPCRTPAFAG